MNVLFVRYDTLSFNFRYRFLLRYIATSLIICCLSFGVANAQGSIVDAQFGIIPDSLFEMSAPSNSTAFPYVVTNKELDVTFQESGGGIMAVLKHHKRVKVFDASVRESSVITIPYYFENQMEQVSNIQGVTYLSDGERFELDEAAIRTININSRYNVKEFTMPRVQDGAVLEYSYVVQRRYIEELPDFYLSQKVPTAHAKVEITYPQYLRYEGVVENFDRKVQHNYSYTDTSSVPKIFTFPRPDPVVTERWAASNIPAVEQEPFISSLDDYRGKIKFILSAFGLPRQELDTSWDVTVAKLRRNRNPLEVIKQYDYARALGDSLAEANPEIGRVALQDSIYRYVNDRMNFSEAYAPYSTELDSAVLDGQVTGQAAINQTLLAMLRGAGISADPVLTSTRSSGTISRDFPSFYQFNALAVQSEIDGQSYIMDASFPFSQPNLISTEMSSGWGLVMKQDSFSWIDMQAEKSTFDIQVEVDGQLQPEGTLTGQVISRQAGYPAQLIRQKKADGVSDLDILKQTLFDGYTQIRADQVQIRNVNDYGGPVEIEARFTIENYATSFTDGLEFNPMLVGYLQQNPFEDKKRDLPVTLNAPEHLDISYSITLPDGFTVGEELLDKNIGLPGAEFNERYSSSSGMLQYDFQIDISRKEFAPDSYPQLLDLYNRWVQLSNSTWLIRR